MAETKKEDKKIKGGGQETDGSGKTELTQEIEETHGKVEAVMDVEPLRRAIDKLEPKPEMLAVMEEILIRSTTSIEDQYRASKVMLTTYFEKLEESKPKDNWRISEYIEQLHEIMQKYKDYFGDIVEEDWYRDINLQIAEEFLRPILVYTNNNRRLDREVLWRAKSLVKRLDFVEEINLVFPVEDIEEWREKAKKCATVIVQNNIDEYFYQNPAVDGSGSYNERDRTEIRGIAKRFDITLPSEQEIWERDISEKVDSLSAGLSELEAEQGKDRQVYELDKRESEIKKATALFREAEEKFDSLKLPEGFDTVQKIVDSLKSRLQAIVGRNREIIIEENWKHFQTDLDSGNTARIQTAVRNLSRIDLPENRSILEEVLAEMNKLKDKQVIIVQEIAAKIQIEPEKAVDLADSLKIHGSKIRQLNVVIQKINERTQSDTDR